jgi:hypothetical protein
MLSMKIPIKKEKRTCDALIRLSSGDALLVADEKDLARRGWLSTCWLRQLGLTLHAQKKSVAVEQNCTCQAKRQRANAYDERNYDL